MKLHSLLALFALSLPAFALDDAPFQELKNYDFQNRKPVETINALIRSADAATQGEIETKLLAVAQDPATTFAAQQEIGKMLWKVGTGRSVPVLSKWLGDEKLNDVARYALERNADPAATQALRTALTTTKGKTLAGVITSVGERRDSLAVTLLKGLLVNPDTAVADAAIAALGKIATPSAITVLQGVPDKSLAVYQALLSAADQTLVHSKMPTTIHRLILDDKTAPSAVRMAAAQSIFRLNPPQSPTLLLELLRGDNADLRDLAARFVRQSDVPTRLLIAEAEKLPAPGQALLLSALADRKQAEVLPLLLRAAASPDAAIRVAALRAFAPLQAGADAKINNDIVLLLAKAIARNNAESNAAREGLYAMRGSALNDAIIAAIPKAEPEARRELVYALGQRYVESAKPLLLQIAADNTSPAQDNAFRALDEVATADDYEAVVKSLFMVKNNGARGVAENLVTRVAKALPDENARTAPLIAALSTAPLETRASVFKVLAALGGGAALQALRVSTQNPDEKVQDAAIRALANIQDNNALPDLLLLAQNAPSKAQQILSLRGYLRLAESVAQNNKGNGAKVAELYAPAIKIAGEAQEKRSIIAGLSKINTPETLALIVPFLDDENTRNEAAQAAINMVREFKGANRKEARVALEKVSATVKDENLLKQSNELLQQLPAS